MLIFVFIWALSYSWEIAGARYVRCRLPGLNILNSHVCLSFSFRFPIHRGNLGVRALLNLFIGSYGLPDVFFSFHSLLVLLGTSWSEPGKWRFTVPQRALRVPHDAI
jgi:hypothetical protein